MNRKTVKKIVLLLIISTMLFQEKINTGGGKSFGLFAGGAVVKKGHVIIPRGNTVIEPDDRLVLISDRSVLSKIEKLLA